jgi:hypothetical protein
LQTLWGALIAPQLEQTLIAGISSLLTAERRVLRLALETFPFGTAIVGTSFYKLH